MKLPRIRGRARSSLKSPDDTMTLTEHLAELRMRIIRSMLAVVLGVIIVITFYDPVLRFLLNEESAVQKQDNSGRVPTREVGEEPPLKGWQIAPRTEIFDQQDRTN